MLGLIEVTGQRNRRAHSSSHLVLLSSLGVASAPVKMLLSGEAVTTRARRRGDDGQKPCKSAPHVIVG
jgi:hypothetical protein